VLLLLVVLAVCGYFTIDTKGVDLKEAAGQTLRYIGIMFGKPAAVSTHWGLPKDASSMAVFLASCRQVLITLALAFLTTLLGAIMALVLGLFAARNLTNEKVSNAIKGFISVIRAIPTVLWVLIFAIGAGLGAVAAVIGMSFHTVGHLLKAYSESFEELDEGVIEALRASGATWPQIVFQAVLPSSITYILSWTFIRFEINFAVAVAMGAAAGAGGIGYELYMTAGYFFDMSELGYITYLIIAVALIMEVIAVRLKRRYHLHE
jgi:phosphonate transport system permease protein